MESNQSLSARNTEDGISGQTSEDEMSAGEELASDHETAERLLRDAQPEGQDQKQE